MAASSCCCTGPLKLPLPSREGTAVWLNSKDSTAYSAMQRQRWLLDDNMFGSRMPAAWLDCCMDLHALVCILA